MRKPKKVELSQNNETVMVATRLTSASVSQKVNTTTQLTTAIKPPEYSPDAAKDYLDEFRPRLLALKPNEIIAARVDLEAAALTVLGVYAYATQAPALAKRLQDLKSIDEFEPRNIEDLKKLGFVLLYANAQAEAAGAFATNARVPASLIRAGTELEARMQELCEYKFRRNEAIMPLLAMLSPGSGHSDLAHDLNGYADIYEMRPDEVASDTTNYLPTDVPEARRIAGEILSHLSASRSPRAREAYDTLQRAWTVLLAVYNEVREACRFVLRYDPQRDEWLPSLFAAARPGVGRGRRPGTPADGGTEEPGPGQGSGGGSAPPSPASA